VPWHDCHYVLYGPYSPSTTITWSSTDTSVVTVTGSGYETTVAPGSSSILARWSEVVGVNYSCAAIYANVTAGATCDVQCAVPNNFHLTNTSGFDAGNGTLHLEYAWGSSTGHLADLAQCTVNEKVDYNSADLPFQSPPFPAGINPPNPTILPVPPIPSLMESEWTTIQHRGHSLSHKAQRLLPQHRTIDIRVRVQIVANLSCYTGLSTLSDRLARMLMARGNL
jgi:hypothetical protein